MTDLPDPESTREDNGDGPLPNRFHRGTALGCLGLMCVLALPALLALPVERWHVTGWVSRLVPLVGVAVVALGVSLLARVPVGVTSPRSTDPTRALTRSGAAPLREVPASSANRLSLLSACLLVLACLGGYLLVSVDTRGGVGELVGTVIVWLGGMVLLAYTLLAARRLVAGPAWLWVRTPIRGGAAPQAIPFGVIGFVAVVWALFVAAGQGYFWAPVGVGVLLLSLALAGPILQRLPPR
ncbi:MAG TPA: hypothetical protein VKQ30_13605 [Ktedonobacterales bacterium]|nr:hypothetical protein [Ktedonobacterales bacterium]